MVDVAASGEIVDALAESSAQIRDQRDGSENARRAGIRRPKPVRVNFTGAASIRTAIASVTSLINARTSSRVVRPMPSRLMSAERRCRFARGLIPLTPGGG